MEKLEIKRLDENTWSPKGWSRWVDFPDAVEDYITEQMAKHFLSFMMGVAFVLALTN